MTALIIALESTELKAHEQVWLKHPAVCGVTLFKRNIDHGEQLRLLTHQIHAVRDDCLICIDQEGGRVRRLGDDFGVLPALGRLGDLFDTDPLAALDAAYWHAWSMAQQIRAWDIDLSFTPVLDLLGVSSVIGDRAFHADPRVVIALAGRYLDGLVAAGVASVGKHFPGHGSIAPDTHIAAACDDRPLVELQQRDLAPFQALADRLDGLMFAHVIYPCLDTVPAGFAKPWADYARQRMGFRGVMISDDLAMTGAQSVGDYDARIAACPAAGMDVALVCQPEWVDQALASPHIAPAHARVTRLQGQSTTPATTQMRVQAETALQPLLA